ncbi:class I SAM-dependent methyltransferase [Gracilimonas mengyeensis]|uniref:Methyltransferase domain-containing protein n=1 Tax=Gracilimonas mengyeensis TaxID=1302730 RepID=A0A521CQM6_9BACT|nr:class I SAM-dependent methyltransferase [Gracilimonas mengyeensis]SMO61708.1 Methyltransferase domain-containing protein [Gracilimonas mengyeensis]
MKKDPANGYESVAREFIAHRSQSTVGADKVRLWAQTLKPNATILDLGCGNGIPITKTLVQEGHTLYGVDASPTLVQSFREHFPDVPVACEPVESSDFFSRTFDGVIAWGLMFLLDENAQSELIHRVVNILKPGGQFLFTSPKQACRWTDVMAGATSRSLGAEEYERILSSAGLSLIDQYIDEGENYYYVARQT